MAIEKLYTKYFQKSRAFLYPALNIKKSSHFSPVETYVSLEGRVFPEDMTLVVLFNKDMSTGFQVFEKKMIIENPLFSKKIETRSHFIYLFNFEMYRDDWFNFLLGKYSKLSPTLKKLIKNFYGETSRSYEYMDSYLYPEKYLQTYADLLNVDVRILKKIGELCDACDLDKENLQVPVEDFVVLDKSA